MSETQERGIEESADYLTNAPEEIARTIAMIGELSRDVERLAEAHHQETSQLHEISDQMNYVRQLVDYSLFVGDRDATDGGVYPISQWLREQFSQVLSAVRAKATTADGGGGAELLEAEERIHAAIESLSVRMIDGLRFLASNAEAQRESIGTIVENGVALGAQPSVLEVQEDIRNGFESLQLRFVDLYRMLAVLEERQGGEANGADAQAVAQEVRRELHEPLASINVRLIDAIRYLASIEERLASGTTGELQNRTETDTLELFLLREQVDKLSARLPEHGTADTAEIETQVRSSIDELGDHLHSMLESITTRVNDVARTVAVQSKQQRGLFDELRAVLQEGNSESGLRQEVVALRTALKSSLESVRVELEHQTQTISQTDAAQRSQLTALKGSMLGQDGAPTTKLDEALELLNVRLVDTMRFLAVIERRQREEIAIREAGLQTGGEEEPPLRREDIEALEFRLDERVRTTKSQQLLFFGVLSLLSFANLVMLSLQSWFK